MFLPGLVTRNICSTLRARGVDLGSIASRVSEVSGLKQEEVWAEGKWSDSVARGQKIAEAKAFRLFKT